MSQDEMNIPLGLLRLTSSLLPVGAFAYSRGLEYAFHAGWVTDAKGLRDWLFGTLEQSFAPLDGALFLRMTGALKRQDLAAFHRHDALLSAARESRELLLEDQRMAEALVKLLRDLEAPVMESVEGTCQSFAAAFALAVYDQGVAPRAGLCALFWTMCEAQVGAAMRLGIFGQSEGQRILIGAPGRIVDAVRRVEEMDEDEIGNVSFMLAVGSALHEDQYSRLFRS